MKSRFVSGAVGFFTAVILGGLLAGCGEQSSRTQGKLRVLTTVAPIYCFAVNVAGDAAEVTNLLPEGSGPHDYQVLPGDIRQLREADLVLANGLGLDDWLVVAMKRSGGKARLVFCTEGVDEEAVIRDRSALMIAAGKERDGGHSGRGGEGDSGGQGKGDSHVHHGHSHDDHSHHGHSHEEGNPHVWLDPVLAKRMVEVIRDALVEADPGNANVYEENAAVYLEELTVLDGELQEALEPLRGVPFVTYHDAFPYLVRRYDLSLAGVVEQVPDVQPSLRYLKRLSDVIREREVRVVFAEPQFSSRLAEQLGVDLSVPVAELDPMETGAFSGSLYEEVMQWNKDQLVKYLGRNAPE